LKEDQSKFLEEKKLKDLIKNNLYFISSGINLYVQKMKQEFDDETTRLDEEKIAKVEVEAKRKI
jgi:HSP90 family molecular chaperone